jgi:toxin-antitoxin system PIN domain toxin
MRALLDVNVLIALHDPDHVHHARARNWFAARAAKEWATCPLTQNGFVRVISQARYPNPLQVPQAVTLLETAVQSPLHEFWTADITILESARLNRFHVHGPGQLSDLYLLALAVSRGGCLATLDPRIPLSAVPGATPLHLEQIT